MTHCGALYERGTVLVLTVYSLLHRILPISFSDFSSRRECSNTVSYSSTRGEEWVRRAGSHWLLGHIANEGARFHGVSGVRIFCVRLTFFLLQKKTLGPGKTARIGHFHGYTDQILTKN